MKPVKVSFTEQAPTIDMPPPKKKQFIDDGKMEPWIELITGGRFYYANPTWDIGAIAHALSMICRFTGHCRKFYSVAEHSILVSRIMEDQGLGDPMEGLLHDGVESVLADIARPAKNLLKDYKTLEKALDASLRVNFKLPETMSEGCMKADGIALLIEARELLPNKGENFTGMSDEVVLAAKKATYMVAAWTPENARERFMTRMHDIRRRTRGLR
jgi:5'-deoxynucleotidase YfbR-like HD superfamily hydrolase